jgi:hypothetical protein
LNSNASITVQTLHSLQSQIEVRTDNSTEKNKGLILALLLAPIEISYFKGQKHVGENSKLNSAPGFEIGFERVLYNNFQWNSQLALIQLNFPYFEEESTGNYQTARWNFNTTYGLNNTWRISGGFNIFKILAGTGPAEGIEEIYKNAGTGYQLGVHYYFNKALSMRLAFTELRIPMYKKFRAQITGPEVALESHF